MSQGAFGPKMEDRLVSCQRVPPPHTHTQKMGQFGCLDSLHVCLGPWAIHPMVCGPPRSPLVKGNGHPRIPWSTTTLEKVISQNFPLYWWERGGGHNWENYFICLFYVSEHLNHLFNFFIHFYFFPEN